MVFSLSKHELIYIIHFSDLMKDGHNRPVNWQSTVIIGQSFKETNRGC
jgi:hypothetical protein